MKKLINPRLKLILQGLLGELIVAPFIWVGLAHGSSRDLPAEWRAVILVVIGVLAFIWFLQCRTPDKTGIKPKWW